MKHARFKLVLLGDSAVGKSSLVHRFSKDSFNAHQESTIGAAFVTKHHQLDSSHTVDFEIWDTAGQERYKSLAPMYYRHASAALVVFDLTDAQSLHRAKLWIKELKLQAASQDIVVVLVGNKSDLVDQNGVNVVEDDEITKFLASDDGQNVQFLQTSAKTGDGVVELFEAVAAQLPQEVWVQVGEESTQGDKGINLNDRNSILPLSSCSC
jgi:Ras-related protein Rab-5C